MNWKIKKCKKKSLKYSSIRVRKSNTNALNEAKKLNNKDIQYIYVLMGSTLSSETETFIKNL